MRPPSRVPDEAAAREDRVEHGRALHVLHVLPNLKADAGGPSRSVPELCRALSRRGLRVSLLTIGRDPGPPAAGAEDDPIEIVSYSPFPGSTSFPDRRFAPRVRDTLREVDVVQLNGLWNPAISLAADACRRARIPYVLSPRGMLQVTAMQRKHSRKLAYYYLWDRRTVAGAAAIHFFNEYDSEVSKARTPLGMRTALIPNGIDDELQQKVGRGRFRARHRSLTGRKIIISVGRVHWSKGLDVQCEAMAWLAKERDDFAWVLVGPDQGAWEELSRSIAFHGLEDRVLWTGLLPHPQVLEAVADANVFLLTSRHEAHSVAMNEALALGCPVVLTDTVGFDAVRRRGAGIVCQRDAVSLAAAIGDAMWDPPRAARMADAAIALAREELAWSRVAEATATLYSSVRENRPRRGMTAVGGSSQRSGE